MTEVYPLWDSCVFLRSDNRTVQGLFWSRPAAGGVWLLASPRLPNLYRGPVCYEDIAYGVLQRNPTAEVNKWWAVIKCVRESLWKARNVLLLREFCVPGEIVMKSILSTFNDHVVKAKSTTEQKTQLLQWRVPNSPLFDNV